VAADRRDGCAPFMVVGTAGTTGAGAIDPLPELARFCRSEDLWFHVDAAWGGAAIVSPRLKRHLAGIEAAHSITCDAHKWFSVPMGCFTRDGLETAGFLATLYKRQIAWMSEVRLAGGEPVLRACVTSYRTTESDVEWVVREMGKLV